MIEVWSFYCQFNGKLRFALNGFTLPVRVRQYFRWFGGGSSRLPCLCSFIQFYFSWNYAFLIKNSIINKQKSSKKYYFFSNVGLWIFEVSKPFGKSRTSGGWSSCTNVNLKPQTWRQGTSHVTSCWNAPKKHRSKVSNLSCPKTNLAQQLICRSP